MAKEARELADFFESQGLPDLAETMRDVAEAAYAAGLHQLPDKQHRGISNLLWVSPEGRRIPGWNLKIGGKGKNISGLERALKEARVNVGADAQSMLKNPEFARSLVDQPVTVGLVMPTVSDLGFPRGATTAEIMGTKSDVDEHGRLAPFTRGRMTKLGLYLSLPEVGVYQRLADQDQEMNTWYYIAMAPITDSNGNPYVFALVRNEDGTWLFSYWAYPGRGWDPEARIVFSLRE